MVCRSVSDAERLEPLQKTVPELEFPSQTWRSGAHEGDTTSARHQRLRQEAPCLNTLRLVQPPRRPGPVTELRVAAWNLERCKHIEATVSVLSREKASICLLTEMDLGMARSANRDTTAEIASALAMGHVFGTEFIELGHGDSREQAEHGATPNTAGIHGNAVLSHLTIDRALVFPLDNHGFWYADEKNKDQRRIGGRNAIAVRHVDPRPFWVISVHFESRLKPIDRALEMQLLLSHIEQTCCGEPVLIGGDFNCKGLQESGFSADERLARPGDAEPMFDALASAGFTWTSCNTSEVTTRNHPWHAGSDRPLKQIDWFFVRALDCHSPAVVPAVGSDGGNLSDHEAVFVTLRF